MYQNVFRYEYLTFQTHIHLQKQFYIDDTSNIQSEYAFLFPCSIYWSNRKVIQMLYGYYSVYTTKVKILCMLLCSYTVHKKFRTTRSCHVILMFKIIYQNKLIIWLWENARYAVNHLFLNSSVTLRFVTYTHIKCILVSEIGIGFGHVESPLFKRKTPKTHSKSTYMQ